MSGYAASARLRGGSLRFIAAAPDSPAEPDRHAATSPTWLDRELVELHGRPLAGRFAERWDELREAWSQTTFFLCHPESWR
jgi:hypothetical protein